METWAVRTDRVRKLGLPSPYFWAEIGGQETTKGGIALDFRDKDTNSAVARDGPRSDRIGPFTILASLWRVFRPELRTHKKALIQDLGLALAAGASGLAGPYLLFLLLGTALRDQTVAPIPVLALGAVGSFAIYAMLRNAHNNRALETTEAMILTLKMRLVRAVMRKPLAFLDAARQAQLTSMLAHDLDKLATQLRKNAGPMLVSALFGVGLLATLSALDWRLGVLVAGLTILYLVGALSIHSATALVDWTDSEADAGQQHILRDMLDGARDIRLYQIQHLHEARFADAAETLRKRDIRLYETPVYGWNSGVEFIASMILLGPVLLGVWLHLRPGEAVPPELVPAVVTYGALLASNLRSFNRGLQAISYLGHALDRLETVIAYPEEPVQPSPSLEAMPDDQTLRLVGIGQRYGTRTILERFDLDVAPSERIALTGRSGIGKTTLANLILRLEEPVTGCVMLGGQPAQRFPIPLYLSYFAHVGHHTHLFHASVRDNIAMGWRHVPFADIERAARLVRLHDVICGLPQGYDTMVGAGDLHLSQGQRQRLALARALIREPAILILDEFTSALDAETKAALLKDLFKVFAGTTMICLTHDPDVMTRMDRVVELAPEYKAEQVLAPEGSDTGPVDGENQEVTHQCFDKASASLRLPAETAMLGRLAEWIDLCVEHRLISDDMKFQINLVLDELVSNIISHGHSDGAGVRTIDIRMERGESDVTLILQDDGAPFDPTLAEPPDTGAPLEDRAVGGLGLHFVRSFMDNVAYQYSDGRNQLILTRRTE